MGTFSPESFIALNELQRFLFDKVYGQPYTLLLTKEMIHNPVQIKKVESMSKSTVIDRWGNEIYITSERWEHILERHDELTDLFDEVLETLRRGKRRQEALDSNRYRYRRPCLALLPEFNHIVVAVVFRFQIQLDGTEIPNNFVTSAWGVDIYNP